MMKVYLLLPLILTALSLKASASTQEEVERERLFKTPSPESLTPGQLRENKEVFLFNESILIEDQGGYTEASYTGTDRNRFSIGYHLSSNYQDPGEISSLEILFSRQLQGYTEPWISFMVKRTSAQYDALAEEINSANGNIRRSGSDQSFTTVGLGGGYRFKTFSKAFGFDRLFETLDAYLTYNVHLDGADDTNYQGFGLQTDYGLHYRAAESFFYGGKLSYNITTVEREKKDDEKLIDRSLVFGWLSLGFEIGYYY